MHALDDNTIVEISRLFGHQLQELMVEVSSLRERINMHSSLAQETDKTLSKLIASIQREMTSQKEACEFELELQLQHSIQYK